MGTWRFGACRSSQGCRCLRNVVTERPNSRSADRCPESKAGCPDGRYAKSEPSLDSVCCRSFEKHSGIHGEVYINTGLPHFFYAEHLDLEIWDENYRKVFRCGDARREAFCHADAFAIVVLVVTGAHDLPVDGFEALIVVK